MKNNFITTESAKILTDQLEWNSELTQVCKTYIVKEAG
jgi:hypothetical protein